MNTTITITPQWQIYVPEKVRELIGLTKPGKADLVVKDNAIIIKPKKSLLLQLGGKYKAVGKKKRVSLDSIRDKIDYSQL